MRNSNSIFLFFLLLFFFVSFNNAIQVYTGDACSSLECILNITELVTVVNNAHSPVELFLYGSIFLDSSIKITQEISIFGFLNASIRANPFASNINLINIKFYSSIWMDSIKVEIPIIISGMTKKKLKEKDANQMLIKKISKDYECYGDSLGKFKYYNRKIIFENCFFKLNNEKLPLLRLGSLSKKTFIDQIILKNNTFTGVDSLFHHSIQKFTNQLSENETNAMNITTKTIINEMTIECNRFIGVIVVNKGLIIKFNTVEDTNYWIPQLYKQQTNEQIFLPSILNVGNNFDLLEGVEEYHSNRKCSKKSSFCPTHFFTFINILNGRHFAILNANLTIDPTNNNNPKRFCVYCNESNLVFNESDSTQNCDILTLSFDSLKRNFHLEDDIHNSIRGTSLKTDTFCNIKIRHFDSLSVAGTCYCCAYENPFRTLLGSATIISSCSLVASDQYIFKFVLDANDSDETKKLSIVGINFVASDSIQENKLLLIGEALKIESMNSKCETTSSFCVDLFMDDNKFIGFETAIFIHLNQKCSSVNILGSIFEFNSVSVKYYQNDRDLFAVNSSCPDVVPNFYFASNVIQNSGGVILSGQDFSETHETNTYENSKEKHKLIHSYSSIENHQKTPAKKDLIEDLRTQILPQYFFKISFNVINTTSDIFICNQLSGFMFNSNNINIAVKGKSIVASSNCQTVSINYNNFTNVLPDSLDLINLYGTNQIINDNLFEGRIIVKADPIPNSQIFHLNSIGIGSFFFFRNFISKDTVFVIPSVEREYPRSQSELFNSFNLKEICQPFCPQLTDVCWEKLNESGDFFKEYQNFRHNHKSCFLSLSSPSTLQCHNCLFHTLSKNDSDSIGTKVIFSDNHLKGSCDLRNFVFEKENRYQCERVTSKNVFFTSNYISKNCKNIYQEFLSDLDYSSLSMILDAPTNKVYLDELGILKNCSHHKRRTNHLSNPPECCEKKEKKEYTYGEIRDNKHDVWKVSSQKETPKNNENNQNVQTNFENENMNNNIEQSQKTKKKEKNQQDDNKTKQQKNYNKKSLGKNLVDSFINEKDGITKEKNQLTKESLIKSIDFIMESILSNEKPKKIEQQSSSTTQKPSIQEITNDEYKKQENLEQSQEKQNQTGNTINNKSKKKSNDNNSDNQNKTQPSMNQTDNVTPNEIHRNEILNNKHDHQNKTKTLFKSIENNMDKNNEKIKTKNSSNEALHKLLLEKIKGTFYSNKKQKILDDIIHHNESK